MSETTTHEKRKGWTHEKNNIFGFGLFNLTTCRTEAHSLPKINECIDKEEPSRVSIVASSQFLHCPLSLV